MRPLGLTPICRTITADSMSRSFDEARSDVDFLVEYPPGYEFGLWLYRFQELEDDLAEPDVGDDDGEPGEFEEEPEIEEDF